MCSGSEAGSYVRLIDFVYHSALGLRVIKKKRRIQQHQRMTLVALQVKMSTFGIVRRGANSRRIPSSRRLAASGYESLQHLHPGNY